MRRQEFDKEMKALEQPTNIELHNCPVIIRVDGKAFHNYYKYFDGHFSNFMQNAMLYAMKSVLQNIPEIDFGYTNSDEITFVIGPNHVAYNNRILKLSSIVSSIVTASFNQYTKFDTLAFFDCRVYSGVDGHTVQDILRWRQSSGRRNMVMTYAREFLSKHEIQNKTPLDLEKLLQEKGFGKVPNNGFRNGYYIAQYDKKVHIAYGDIGEIIQVYWPITFLQGE